MIAIGDIVEVRQMTNRGDERWVGARVIGITTAHIEVKIGWFESYTNAASFDEPHDEETARSRDEALARHAARQRQKAQGDAE